jgi:glutamate synthase (NADPH/NADH) large chain
MSCREDMTFSDETNTLYNPNNEHDSCGVGFVADIKGKKSHSTVADGLTILKNLIHRGALAGDGKTGDGAGILTQIPHLFFLQESLAGGFTLPDVGSYGVASLFLPVDKASQEIIKTEIENICIVELFEIITWRDVPVDSGSLGEIALNSAPVSVQLFLSSGKVAGEELERRLLLLRKIIENRIVDLGYLQESFYVVSLSSKTIVYKGMLVGAQVGEYYTDLTNTDFQSAISVVHQRYSTNTFPSWALAQPFRMVAHNGEINTINGNKNRMNAREKTIKSNIWGDDIKKLYPIISPQSSDSASFDSVYELLVRSGRSLSHSMMMMVPEPFGKKYHTSQDKKDFYRYHASIMEPWDGPAALVFTDGDQVGATLDRNGLRPARYVITKSGKIVLGSEVGVVEFAPEEVLKKGALGPGKMLIVDTQKGRIILDREIKSRESRRVPFRRWLEKESIELHGLFHKGSGSKLHPEKLIEWHRVFGYSKEDVEILKKMAIKGQEPIGSMGNDTPLPFLSDKPQSIYRYFKQKFAQVTNPPLDPYRESMGMSLMSFIGNEGNLLEESPKRCHQLKLSHPILSNSDILRLREEDIDGFSVATISTIFSDKLSLSKAIENIEKEAEIAIDSGISLLILSDRGVDRDSLPIPSLIALSVVHTHLVKIGKRHLAGVVVETGELITVTSLALQVGYGASAVNPYAVFETIANLADEGVVESVQEGVDNYIKGLKKGLLKIMSKMGVATIRSYRGAELFEIIGLSQSFVDRFFTGTTTAVGGVGLEQFEESLFKKHELAFDKNSDELIVGGRHSYKKDGEFHSLNPISLKKLNSALLQNSYKEYLKFSTEIEDGHPSTIRSLLSFKSQNSISLEEVESESDILKRFVSGAISMGSISSDAHSCISRAFNKIGSRSNCGEGGESPTRKDDEISKIRQVASGRFGVTAEYLAEASELQIKLAQGAKPGEGGQLPAKKVTAEIASLRHSTEGVMLISPPPHHDIYSIEDLAQLIYDLRSINSGADISVKLVSSDGVGTIAAGVVKAGANRIVIGGHDGGTGAAPLSSIFSAGMPWELGVAETHLTLAKNLFRRRVSIEADGKILTGRDVVVAALLGADRVAFGTSLLLAEGCIMCRKCHLNTCPVGIATQDLEKIKKFKGDSDTIVAYLKFVARETREIMGSLGVKSFEELVGRVDLLEENKKIINRCRGGIDLSALLFDVELSAEDKKDVNSTPVKGDVELIKRLAPALKLGHSMEIDSKIVNRDRSIGAALASEVIKARESGSIKNAKISCSFSGSAGQSFGAFLVPEISFKLVGDANDYLAKGLSGGEIIVTPPANSKFRSHDSVIAGNVALFGATSGELFINGVAGERFAVRNSGATTVVVSVGNNACEYMTGGTVVVLDKTGINFGAGMSGGVAYVLDRDQLFDTRCNLELVDLEPIETYEDEATLKELIQKHAELTGSRFSDRIIEDWDEMLPQFVKVIPVEYRAALERQELESAVLNDSISITEEIYE